MKTRLDKFLVEAGLAQTRSQAKDLISRGKVQFNGEIANKVSLSCGPDDKIEITEEKVYVSRGAHKILGALSDIEVLNFENKIVLDIGASTGGFTQVALEKGCKHVFAIDVGTNQLHELIKKDSRVSSLENTNIRTLEFLPQEADIVVADLSFISLKLVLPKIVQFLRTSGEALILFKPQFEVGKNLLPKDGVVKNRETILQSLEDFFQFCRQESMAVKKVVLSKVIGKTGNREFFFYLEKNGTEMNLLEWENFCKTL
jgi:23S rRNA (cytidine1920-2'-O)/16S rRNA (cytidine1409-2'-O)-methyltransferase